MKTHSLFFATAMASVLLLSCTKTATDQEEKGGNKESSAICFSKIQKTGSYDYANTQIGLTIGEPVNLSNIKLTVDKDGNITPEKELFWGDGQTGASSFTAYIPYNASYTGKEQIDFAINADQSTSDLMNGSILLVASTSAKPSSSPISLTFSYKVAGLDIWIKNDTGKTIQDVYIIDVINGISLNLQTGECVPNTASKSSIKMLNQTTEPANGMCNYRAVIAPQKSAQTLKVTFTDGTYTVCDFKIGTETECEAKQYTNSDKPVVLTPEGEATGISFALTVNDWEFGGDIIFGDEGGDTPPSTGTDGVYSETFAGYQGSPKSGYSAQESFTSSATGVTWTLDFGSIDQTEDYQEFYNQHCFTLGGKAGKDDYGQSVLTTSVLTDGITKLEFDYVANASKKLEVQVLVGGTKVWSSGEMELVNNGQSETKVLEHKSFSITGAASNAVVKFINVSSARRISIGNITWTNATGEGGNGPFDGSTGGGEGGEEGGDDEVYTSLTSDLVVSDINYAEAYQYGDAFESGTDDWLIAIGNDDEELAFELFTASGASTPVGTYTIDTNYTLAAGTIWDGSYSDEGILPGYCNYTTYDYAYPSSGTLSIAKSGSNYTITVRMKDELGHSITADYSGTLTIKDGYAESESYITKSASLKNGKNINRSKAVLRKCITVKKSAK